MLRTHTSKKSVIALLALALVQSVFAADDELGALSLQSANPTDAKSAQQDKVFVEGAAGWARQNGPGDSRGIGRLSLDGRTGGALGTPGRYALSARLDATSPRDARIDNPVFSLREAYVSWQDSDAAHLLDLGRINLRNGPAYGYNPTDFFRDNALRTITTADPFALRENRLGTVMLRGQKLWTSGSVSLALAPKLDSRRSDQGLSFDWGATNSRQRALLTVSNRWGDAFSSQLLVYKEQGTDVQWGASATALLSDALTGHAEWARSRESDLLQRALSLPAPTRTDQRATLGLTYTTAGKLSLTAEAQYNGFAMGKNAVRALPALDPNAAAPYFGTALSRQDNAARRSVLVYATQRDVFVKNLEWTALAKFNQDDASRLAWIELRYRMDRTELALQFQRSTGHPLSEFGSLPLRESLGVIATAYF